jgi:hypothetical protein
MDDLAKNSETAIDSLFQLAKGGVSLDRADDLIHKT